MGKGNSKKNKTVTENRERESTSFKCKSCEAITFGRPVVIKGINYCKYCAEKDTAQ